MNSKLENIMNLSQSVTSILSASKDNISERVREKSEKIANKVGVVSRDEHDTLKRQVREMTLKLDKLEKQVTELSKNDASE